MTTDYDVRLSRRGRGALCRHELTTVRRYLRPAKRKKTSSHQPWNWWSSVGRGNFRCNLCELQYLRTRNSKNSFVLSVKCHTV